MNGILGCLGSDPGNSPAWEAARTRLAGRCPAPETRCAGLAGVIVWRGMNRADLHADESLAVVLDGYLSLEGGSGSWATAEEVAGAYRTHGMTVFRQMRGCFAAAVLDHREQAFHLSRSPFGTHPLYYTSIGSSWRIASELKPLRAQVPEVLLDPVGLRDSANFRFAVGPQTLLAGQHLVPPGTVVSLRAGVPPRQVRLAVPRINPGDGGSWETWTTRSGDALDRAMERLARRCDTVAIPLSGGMDSSLIAAMARNHFKSGIGYAAEIEGYANPELGRARIVAARLGLPLRIVPVTRDDVARLYPSLIERIESPPRHFNNFVVARLFEAMAHEVDGVLLGELGDTVFGTGVRASMARLRRRITTLHRIPGSVRRAAAALLKASGHRRGRSLAALLTSSYREMQVSTVHLATPWLVSPATRAVWEALTGGVRISSDIAEYCDAMADGDDGLAHAYGAVVTGGASLERDDRLTAPLGIDVLYPFLDRDVMDVGFGLPLEFREDGRAKPVLRRLAREALGDEITNWPKLGFPSPDVEWIEGPLAPFLAVVCQPDPFLDSLVPLTLRQRLRLPRDHQMLWTLMGLKATNDLFGFQRPGLDFRHPAS